MLDLPEREIDCMHKQFFERADHAEAIRNRECFRVAVRIEQTGHRIVTIVGIVTPLETVNWNCPRKQANSWIECYVTTFKDISSDKEEVRTFMLFEPNGALRLINASLTKRCGIKLTWLYIQFL